MSTQECNKLTYNSIHKVLYNVLVFMCIPPEENTYNECTGWQQFPPKLHEIMITNTYSKNEESCHPVHSTTTHLTGFSLHIYQECLTTLMTLSLHERSLLSLALSLNVNTFALSHIPTPSSRQLMLMSRNAPYRCPKIK